MAEFVKKIRNEGKKIPEAGWVEDLGLPELPEDAVKAAESALKSRRGISEEKAKEFISWLKRVWRTANRPIAKVDRPLSQERFEEIEKISTKLNKALNRLSGGDLEALVDESGPLPDIGKLKSAAKSLADLHRREKGDYDRFSSADEHFVNLASAAWFQVFGKRPSPNLDGPFASTINEILQAADRLQWGKDALRQRIRPIKTVGK